jgi:hypothetical protein
MHAAKCLRVVPLRFLRSLSIQRTASRVGLYGIHQGARLLGRCHGSVHVVTQTQGYSLVYKCFSVQFRAYLSMNCLVRDHEPGCGRLISTSA